MDRGGTPPEPRPIWIADRTTNRFKMDFKEKSKIAFNMVARAETGLSFLDDFLVGKTGTDTAWSRSLYILLSYNFELILKSSVVLASNATVPESLEKELQKLSHHIKKIADTLDKKELLRIGIVKIESEISRSFLGYIIETTDGNKIRVEDFTNVRYDFISNKLRQPTNNEVEKIRTDILSMRGFLSKIKEKIDFGFL